MQGATIGLVLLLLAGAMNGSFTLPMKFTRKWAWENTWLIWTVFALFLFPPLLTSLTVPGVGSIYREVGIGAVIAVASFGAGWGISQVFFGLAVESVGIALAFSVILGISAAVGSLIPLIRLHPDKIATPGGLFVISGVFLTLLGVAVCAIAGRRREALTGGGPTGKPSVGKGLVFCSISGLGSALVNFGLAFGAPILASASRHGVSRILTPNVVWLPFMVAGGIPNIVYCVYLIRKNKTARRFGEQGTTHYWMLAALMAFFWFCSTVMYGASTTSLGELGAILAWPLFMSLIVISATVIGVFTGEWKLAGRGPLVIMSGGVCLLVVAIFVLSYASRWV